MVICAWKITKRNPIPITMGAILGVIKTLFFVPVSNVKQRRERMENMAKYKNYAEAMEARRQDKERFINLVNEEWKTATDHVIEILLNYAANASCKSVTFKIFEKADSIGLAMEPYDADVEAIRFRNPRKMVLSSFSGVLMNEFSEAGVPRNQMHYTDGKITVKFE